MIGALRSFDSSVLKRKVKQGTAKRALSFASAYAGLLGLFVLVVIGSAGIGITNPLSIDKSSTTAYLKKTRLSLFNWLYWPRCWASLTERWA
jgi:hypothetical protein